MAASTTFRFGEIEAILADINGIPSAHRTSFQARLKDIQRNGLLRMDALPRGKAAAYGLRELTLLAVAVEMCQFGLSGKRAVQVMLDDEDPLWTAVSMAARLIEARPEVFNCGPGDTGNPPDRKLWGFSPDWRDNEESDPESVFLHFDPSVLAPWAEPDDAASDEEQEGRLTASETFFFAGIGVVRDNLSRWTTGMTRRVALINVTKLVFDLAARVSGADGLTVCKGFGVVANSIITRGDFDLDEWLARVTKLLGMRVAADPRHDQSWMPLGQLVDLSEEPFARYLVPVPQVSPSGEPDYIKDRQRPDLIIRLPGQRELRVDAKVSPSTDIPQGAIDWRLQELAEKPYHGQFADRTNWTVLYLPDENFLAGAMAADRFMIDKALAQNVLIATPGIFMNLLAEVDTAWTKYREQFPDLGNEEWQGLHEEHRPHLAPDYSPAERGLPNRVSYPERKVRNGDR